ncbi:WW domain-containing oxidoreductase-like protein [Mucor mucedo]|uniref:WW domain-containing oxidoreductase-like protein n=1 Tax=Mucor mucedo TaxID=29922 RepID=UPI00221FD736|nr:WW domain-containing oxidoreductase-like protein [Mucor mucedo]KAI7867310.1 WW domain-containing oxidoreductase-like protein [Mucor mucedo]
MADTIVWNTTAEEIIKIYKTDLSGKVVIVTGSNAGIGLEIARVLSLAGAKVIIPSRTLEKSHQAIATIHETVPQADLIPMQLDLSDFATVRKFAQDFLALNLPLDILVNNAGIVIEQKVLTKDGFESQFAVNHLGHFLLTQLLEEKIKASAPSRIVITSSAFNAQFNPITGLDFDNLNGEKEGYSMLCAYGRSKLCNIYHAKELQRRFNAQGVDVTVTSLHPGNVKTKMNGGATFSILKDLLKHIRRVSLTISDFMSPKDTKLGASTSVLCAVSPNTVKGAFYNNNKINTDLLHEEAENEEAAKRLWDLSEKLLSK